MTWYAVYRVSDGTLASEGSSVADDTVLTEKGLAKKSYQSKPAKLWNPETQEYDIDIPVVAARISVADFKARFTLNEHAGIITAGRTDALIAAFLDRVNTSGILPLDHPDVLMGVQYLVQQGVITEQRAAEILA